LLDWHGKDARDPKRQRQRRRIATTLDGNHGLTGNTKLRNQLSLRHSPPDALFPNSISAAK
jgi:hypothetical protein